MDADEANSWLRRTKFSHSVCRRLESAASLPLSISPEGIAGLKSRPGGIDFPHKNSLPANMKILENPIFPAAKQRSASPLPETVLPETFKEARSEKKRFSTPYSRKSGWDKGIKGKFIKHNSKTFSNAKSKKDSLPWTKYFDNGGGKVTAVDAVDEYMVDLSKLFLGLRFAHGAHSRLYHGVYRDEPVAVKIIRIPDDYENEDLGVRLEKQFSREVTLLSRLHHHNVIRFVAACRDAPVFCIITEYLSEGSLRGYLHKLEHKPLPLEKLIAIALDIARGMKYIHSQGVIHRDLKPENILIQEGFCMKIADFGIACEEANFDALSDDPGTYRWMAPEMIKDKSYGRKVDVYSFGLILWEMVAGAIPYEDMTPIQAAFAVVDKNTRPVIPADCPPAVRVLIEQCWLLQPEKRPEFWQVVKLLENFESLLATEGTLNQLSCEDHKGILQWIQKPRPVNLTTTGSFALVPKFL